jgi:hypothetical protein
VRTTLRGKTASLSLALILGSGIAFYGGRSYQNSIDQPLIEQYTPPQTTSGAPAQAGSGAIPVTTASAGTPVVRAGGTARAIATPQAGNAGGPGSGGAGTPPAGQAGNAGGPGSGGAGTPQAGGMGSGSQPPAGGAEGSQN